MDITKILIIDDDKNILMIAEIGLSDTPEWEVVKALTAEEGLAKAVADRPDLILLDMVMPDMDGIAALTKLRQTAVTATIPVIFMTARASQDEIDNYTSLGAQGVIVKPFDPMSLSQEIRSIISGSGPTSGH
jgi:DNA-binding response OmpR family regulator